eukprot:359517-Chlamydomonas_euryale.AAC.25
MHLYEWTGVGGAGCMQACNWSLQHASTRGAYGARRGELCKPHLWPSHQSECKGVEGWAFTCMCTCTCMLARMKLVCGNEAGDSTNTVHGPNICMLADLHDMHALMRIDYRNKDCTR